MTFRLANLRTFETVARLLSFTLAAETLHLTQSAVSQQIKQLETDLGFTLFRRLTRRLVLTEEGTLFYEMVRRSLAELDRTVEELRSDTARGSVVIGVDSTFASNWLIPRVGRFRDACPEINLQIQPSDTLPDLNREPEVDLAVRFSDPGLQKMVVRRLGWEKVFAVANPTLLQSGAAPEDLADLRRFTLIHNAVSDSEPGSSGDWRNWLGALGHGDALNVSAGPRYPRSDLVVQASVHGEGVALVWDTMVRNELADGRLVKLFGGRFETSGSYFAWCTPAAHAKPKVQAVLSWLEAEASAAQ